MAKPHSLEGRQFKEGRRKWKLWHGEIRFTWYSFIGVVRHLCTGFILRGNAYDKPSLRIGYRAGTMETLEEVDPQKRGLSFFRESPTGVVRFTEFYLVRDWLLRVDRSEQVGSCGNTPPCTTRWLGV